MAAAGQLGSIVAVSAALAQQPAAPGVPVQPQPAAVAAVPAPGVGPVSGQPVPRFVSLKADKVNVRRGPGPDHGIDWVFRRAGLPVEVIAESETWRRVRDAEGSTGWVLAALLSGRRTALVEPWEKGPQPPQMPLRAEARDGAAEVIKIEAGVIANVRMCDGRWCLIGVGEHRGYIEQRRLWGVYKGESLKP